MVQKMLQRTSTTMEALGRPATALKAIVSEDRAFIGITPVK